MSTAALRKYELEDIQDNSSRNLFLIVFILGAIGWGAYLYLGEFQKGISKKPVETLRLHKVSEFGSLPEKLYMLAGSAKAQDESAQLKSINNVFSPVDYIATLPEPKPVYKAPPKPEKVEVPKIYTQTVDVKNVFRSLVQLDGVSANGAFINARFYRVGDVLMDRVPEGKRVNIKALLAAVQGDKAYFDVNGEQLVLALKYEE